MMVSTDKQHHAQRLFFLSANPDDQKIPNFLLNRISALSGVKWEIIAIPMFRPSEYRYNFSVWATLSVSRAPHFLITPLKIAPGDQTDFELSKIGFSVSWFNGYDPFTGLI